MSQIDENLRVDLIEEEDKEESVPDELHQIFEDQTYDYYHSKKTKIFFYICVALNGLDFIIFLVEYGLILNSGKYYYNLTLKSRIIAMIIFFGLSILGLLLYLFVNITAIYQYYKKYFYCTRSRLNYFGTMVILLLLINGALIVSNILVMREYLPDNCNDNEQTCVLKYCNISEESNQFSVDYDFNPSDKNACINACVSLINNKCRKFSSLSYVPVVFSSILFILSLVLIKIVCLTEEKEH